MGPIGWLFNNILLGALFGLGIWVAWAAGWRNGRRMHGEHPGDVAFKLDEASMALLGLLVGFTFAMALGKYDQRRLAAVEDASSLGDFYTCASLLDEPVRSELRTAIREYTVYRLEIARGGMPDRAKQKEIIGRIHAMQDRMGQLVGQALKQGTPIAVPLTNTLNGVTSNNTRRIASARDRVPNVVIVLLFVASFAASYLTGRRQGREGSSHRLGTAVYMILTAFAIYVILDLNQPQQGAVRVSQAPIEEVLSTMPAP